MSEEGVTAAAGDLIDKYADAYALAGAGQDPDDLQAWHAAWNAMKPDEAVLFPRLIKAVGKDALVQTPGDVVLLIMALVSLAAEDRVAVRELRASIRYISEENERVLAEVEERWRDLEEDEEGRMPGRLLNYLDDLASEVRCAVGLRAIRRRAPEPVRSWVAGRRRCRECGRYVDDRYLLTPEVWRRVHPDIAGELHIRCAERRLGRLLTRDDFADVPINDPEEFALTPVHRDRLENVEDDWA